MDNRLITEEEHQKRTGLYNEGLSDYKIGFICKYDHNTIYKWRSKNGLPKNNPRGRKCKTA